MASGKLQLRTSNQREFVDITTQLQEAVTSSAIHSGLLVVYNPHTTAGVTINEGADPDVQSDLIGVFSTIIPEDFPYRHQEGNSPAHMMATLTGSSMTLFIENGRIQSGTWQHVFFCEYDGPRNRTLWWKVIEG